MFWPFKKKVITESVEEVKPQAVAPKDTINTLTFGDKGIGVEARAKPVPSDDTRVNRYIEDGGEIVDLSNKPRLPNDGFASDQDMMKPWNQAHVGTKAGIAAMGKKR